MPHAPVPPTLPVSCSHCGSNDLVVGIRLNQNAEVGSIGLPFKTGIVFVGTEPLLADLCRTCGTVLRFYVLETRRAWIQK